MSRNTKSLKDELAPAMKTIRAARTKARQDKQALDAYLDERRKTAITDTELAPAERDRAAAAELERSLSLALGTLMDAYLCPGK